MSNAKRRAFYDERTLEAVERSFRRNNKARRGSRLDESLRERLDRRRTERADEGITSAIEIPNENNIYNDSIIKQIIKKHSDNQGAFSMGTNLQ